MRPQKKPAPLDGGAGCGKLDYLDDCIIGAGAGAGGFGQQEAASAETAAAAMRNLAIFMLFGQLLVVCPLCVRRGMTDNH
jgi:hypothetical protein